MTLQITTVCTKERLLRFYFYYQLVQRVWFPIILGFDMILMTAWVIKDFLNGPPVSESVVAMFGIVWIIGLTWVVAALILPLFTVKKAKNLNTVTETIFGEEGMHYKMCSTYATQEGELKYGMFVKYIKNKNDLYLFVSARQAWIVDMSALDAQQVQDLKALLEQKIVSKKNKWH